MFCEQHPVEPKDYIRDRVAQPEMTMMDEQMKRNGNGRNEARSYLHSPHFHFSVHFQHPTVAIRRQISEPLEGSMNRQTSTSLLHHSRDLAPCACVRVTP